MLSTYRSRLIFYTFLLAAFLAATLAYTYIYSRNVILEQAEANISNTAHLLASNIEMEENELLHYAELVRDDPRIKEYMFMITNIGADADALAIMYERNFGWLPIDRVIFISNDGHVQLGKDYPDLTEAVFEHKKQSTQKVFYFQGNRGLELVAWAPVSYQDIQIGAVAVTHVLDIDWLYQHAKFSGGHLFIELNNTVQLSTLANSSGITFLPHGNTIVLQDEIYRVRAISLAGEGMSTPHLWHGISEQNLLNQLERHSQRVLFLTIIGCIAIFITGLMIVRNFNRPLSRLMKITHSVTQGNLPVMKKLNANNEIDTLANRFAEMLKSLRDKQTEIDVVHKQLEASSITDALTGLYNRRYLKQIFPKLLAQAQRENHHLSGLMLDLDYFKDVNDQYGHLAGDQCLSHIAHILTESCRASDYIFRMGGEEFLVLSLSDSLTGGECLAKKIRQAIEQSSTTFKNTNISLTASIGIGHTDNKLPPESALTNLLYHADNALYAAKEKGRNRVILYNDLIQSPMLHDASS